MTATLSDVERHKAIALVMRYFEEQGFAPDYLATEVHIGDYDGEPHPVVYFEAGFDNWALRASDDLIASLDKLGVFAEPVYSFALGLYPKEVN